MVQLTPEKYTQKKDGWCGQASLSYALAQQGVDVPQQDIAEKTTTGTEGLDPYVLEAIAMDQGMQTEVFQGQDPVDTLDMLGMALQDNWSIVLDYLDGDSYEDGHYVVLNEIDGQNLVVFDPSIKGKIKMMSKKKFIEHWRDRDAEGNKFKYYALAIKAS